VQCSGRSAIGVAVSSLRTTVRSKKSPVCERNTTHGAGSSLCLRRRGNHGRQRPDSLARWRNVEFSPVRSRSGRINAANVWLAVCHRGCGFNRQLYCDAAIRRDRCLGEMPESSHRRRLQLCFRHAEYYHVQQHPEGNLPGHGSIHRDSSRRSRGGNLPAVPASAALPAAEEAVKARMAHCCLDHAHADVRKPVHHGLWRRWLVDDSNQPHQPNPSGNKLGCGDIGRSIAPRSKAHQARGRAGHKSGIDMPDSGFNCNESASHTMIATWRDYANPGSGKSVKCKCKEFDAQSITNLAEPREASTFKIRTQIFRDSGHLRAENLHPFRPASGNFFRANRS